MKGRTKLGTAAVAVAVPLTIIALVHGCDPPPLGFKASERGDIEATRTTAAGVHCGVERWSVKTLQDPAAATVALKPKATSVIHLASLPVPPGADGPRVPASAETQVWKLRGTHLIGYKQEGDSDFHLILQSAVDHKTTMIAEIPDPACATSSTQLAALATVRAEFVQEIGQPTGSFTTTSQAVTVTGVGLFDRLHGQSGVAPNGIELHPLLSFREGT